jgi:enoyl-CoA hydratase
VGAATANEVLVRTERRGRVGILTLDRPQVINALNHDMVLALADALLRWAEDDSVETVVIRGSGERGLCAGGDIVAIHRGAVTGGTSAEAFWRDEYALNALIARYPKPYVALMDGFVLGGGVGVSAHGSHRIVTERSKVGMPETRIGFIPDVGGTWLLSRGSGELGTYLALTGAHVGAADAIAAGLADHVVPSASLSRLVDLLAERDVASALSEIVEPTPGSVLANQRWIDEVFSADDVTSILAALRARPEPDAAVTAADLLRNSPTALEVTLRAIRRARHMARLEDALALELRIGLHLLHEHDFAEGIRAQVVDKDRRPRWKPATLADVTTEQVDAVFAAGDVASTPH